MIGEEKVTQETEKWKQWKEKMQCGMEKTIVKVDKVVHEIPTGQCITRSS